MDTIKDVYSHAPGNLTASALTAATAFATQQREQAWVAIHQWPLPPKAIQR
jgi:hypothetical protein